MESELKKTIMRRIYFVYYAKTAFNSPLLKLAVLLMIGYGFKALISIESFFVNMPSIAEINSLASFILAAFLNTEFIVQAMTLGTAIFAVWLLRDVVAGFREVSFEKVSA